MKEVETLGQYCLVLANLCALNIQQGVSTEDREWLVLVEKLLPAWIPGTSDMTSTRAPRECPQMSPVRNWGCFYHKTGPK